MLGRPWFFAIWLVAGVLLAGACDADRPEAEPDRAQQGEVQRTETPDDVAASPTVASPDSPAIASAETKVKTCCDVLTVQVDINSVEVVDDSTTTLRFTITPVESKEGAEDGDLQDEFMDPTGTVDVRDSDDSVDGVHLIDTLGQKKYLVYRDEDGSCVCTFLPLDFPVGEPVASFANFPALPPEVEHVTVVVPHFPPFENVPITR